MTPVTQILAGIAAFAVVFVLGCANGYIIRDSAAKTAAAKAHKAAYEQLKEKQGEIVVLSAKYEAERERANKVLHERTNTIREYYNNVPAVAPSCALPDPMYGLLVNSVRDANAYATSELGSDVPDPTPTAKTGN
jgi:hypothetical protein